jgi:hypothetical protein
MSVWVERGTTLMSGGSSRVGGGGMQLRRNRLRLGLVLLVSLVGLLSVGVGSASAVTTTPSCGTSGTFTITDNVVTGNTSCAGAAVIPSGVTSIGTSAFWNTSGLTSVTIPDSVISIGASAFGEARGLTSVTISASVTTIGSRAFYYTTSVTNFAVDEANPNYKATDGALFNKAGTTLISYPTGNTRTSYTTPSSVTTIDERAFQGAAYLTNVTIGSGVTTIGDAAFSGTTSLVRVYFEGTASPSVGVYGFGRSPTAGATAYRFAGSTGFTTTGSTPKWNGLLVDYYLATPPAPVAVAGVESATITVTAPSVGPTPTSYLVTASSGGGTCTVTGASGSCTITGCTAATTYTFTAVAKTASPDVTSLASAASNGVAPTAAPVVVPETPVVITTVSADTTIPPALSSNTVVPTQTPTGLVLATVITEPGTLVLRLTTRSTRSTHVTTQLVCTTTKQVTKAGKITLKCPYTKAARRMLAKSALAVTSTTTFTPTLGTATTTTTTLTLKRIRIATPRPIGKPTTPSSVTG